MIKRILIAGGLLAALLSAAPLASAGGDDGGPRRGRIGARIQRRHHRAMHFLKHLGLTEEQKALVKEVRAAAAPVREDVKKQVVAILEEARKGERTPEARKAVREKIRAVVQSAQNAFEREARRILDSLTAEQRQKISDAAAKRGKTVDDAKLLKGIERLLLAPGGRHGGRSK